MTYSLVRQIYSRARGIITPSLFSLAPVAQTVECPLRGWVTGSISGSDIPKSLIRPVTGQDSSPEIALSLSEAF